jgi:hypothetical protein
MPNKLNLVNYLAPRQKAALNARTHRKGFTPEGLERLRQSAISRRLWEAATGPRTSEGKARSARNAWKGGLHARLRLLGKVRVQLQQRI